MHTFYHYKLIALYLFSASWHFKYQPEDESPNFSRFIFHFTFQAL